jgi:hypothetical protein
MGPIQTRKTQEPPTRMSGREVSHYQSSCWVSSGIFRRSLRSYFFDRTSNVPRSRAFHRFLAATQDALLLRICAAELG